MAIYNANDIFVVPDDIYPGTKEEERGIKEQYCDHVMFICSYCNSKRPPGEIRSSWNQLDIVFISDASRQRRGFHAVYQQNSYSLPLDFPSYGPDPSMYIAVCFHFILNKSVADPEGGGGGGVRGFTPPPPPPPPSEVFFFFLLVSI